MKYGNYMARITLTEEINRIIQINEYGYDYDDVSSNRQYRVPQISYNGSAGSNKDNKKKEKLSPEERSERTKEAHKSHPLDINNQKDRLTIFKHLSKHNNINNATKETLRDIDPLKHKQRYARVRLSIDDELEFEYGYYLLTIDKCRITNWGGIGFGDFYLSPTFNSLLNKEHSGFKRWEAPSFEDFKKFITTNRKIIEKEIEDYLSKNK
jgi:hypothetical protein